MLNVSTAINSLLTIVLGCSGAYFFFTQHFRFLPHPTHRFGHKQASSQDSKNPRSLTPFASLCIALGGTVGVGNTIGVAYAVVIGGAGSVFWMWISALFGIALKYAEVYLAHRHRDKNGLGGAMVLLEKLGHRRLACLFCFACILVSFGMGNLAQTGAASASLQDAFSLPRTVSGAALALLCLWIFSGGLNRLATFSKFAIPLASAIFLGLCFCSIYQNKEYLKDAISSIFRDALTIPAIKGGTLGSFIRMVSVGFSRGIFSNEAGLGSAPLVHSHSGADASKQAQHSSWEVILDTHVICTICALSILTSTTYRQGSFQSADTLCAQLFGEQFGQTGARLFSVSLFLFAAASIVAWGFYGKTAVDFLRKNTNFPLYLYFGVFILLVFLGASFKLDFVLLFSDFANACMCIPNLYALIQFRKELQSPFTKKS